MKTLIDNIIALAVAALCTFLISIATLPFNGTGMASRYIYDLIHQRGPAPLYIVFFGVYVLALYIASVIKRNTNRPAILVLTLISLCPGLWGAIATAQAFSYIDIGIKELELNPHAIAKGQDVTAQITVAKLVAYDPLIFGLGVTCICLGCAFHLWRLSNPNKEFQQAGPGYPPQGVGSPDP